VMPFMEKNIQSLIDCVDDSVRVDCVGRFSFYAVFRPNALMF